MATTGELRAIIEELQLVDAGDAASYLGGDDVEMDELLMCELQKNLSNLTHSPECANENAANSHHDDAFR